MRSEALQHTEGEDERGHGAIPLLSPKPLALFAAVLLGRPFDPPDGRLDGLVRWARSEAFRAVTSGRAHITDGAVFGYRLLYEALRPEAAPASPLETPMTRPEQKWVRVVGALRSLRHRQRAAVVLAGLAGMSPRQVAGVLSIAEREAARIVASGRSRVIAALGEPADIRRALVTACARLEAAAPAAPAVTAAPARTARRRRSAVAAIVTAPPSTDSTHPVIRVLESRRSGRRSPDAARRRPRRSRTGPARLALAAAVSVLLVAGAIVPSAGPVVVAQAPPTIQAADDGAGAIAIPVARATRPVIAVRPGDSLWRIAERRLGDGERWRGIWALNRGRRMTPGERFTDPRLIRPRWTLLLPAGG